jgi:transposase
MLMEVIHQRCAGLDVHKKTVVVCVRVTEGATVSYETRTFGTTTPALLALGDWLQAHGCTHAVVESTGVYWKPIWHVLAESLTLVLANAAGVRNVPGRKSDVSDARWLADLLALGLVRASFVPPAPIEALRELTRTRKQLVRERTAHTQRIQKLLECANLKLTSVLKETLGPSGRAVLEGLAAGETDPERLADRLHPRSRHKRAEVAEALCGTLRPHQRLLLGQHLQLIAALETSITRLEEEIATALAPFRPAVGHLLTLPGVSATVAGVLVAEIGTDMSRFPSAGHLRSWAGLCPRLDESAGRPRSRRLRKGAPWLKPVLVQAAWSAIQVRDSYARAQYYRLRARVGKKKAIVAVAAALLTAAYHMLRDGQDYRDRGAAQLTEHDRHRMAQRLGRRLRELGYEVTMQRAA